MPLSLPWSPAAQDEWPQWRGVDGMGVSRETSLPTRLGADSPECLWRAEVPGEGVSSPIVKGERVFLTTAYPSDPAASTAALRYALPLVAALAVGLLLARRAAPGGAPGRLVARLDGLLLALGTLLLPAAVLVVAFRPGWLWEAGSQGYRWIYTSLLALGGSAVALAWPRPGSVLRVLGAGALLAAAWALFRDVPTNAYGKAFRPEIRLAMIAPALAGAAWHVLVFVLARAAPARRGAVVAALGASASLAAAWGAFALANHLTPAAGVERAVVCYDFDTGKRLWLTPLFVAPEEKKHAENSFATPTPCATDTVVFVHFGSGYAALDHQGRVLWTRLDDDYHQQTRYGASSSPVLLGDTVLYLHDKESGLGPSYLTRIELATGEARWYRETTVAADSYMTPLLVERAGERQLVAVTSDWILGYDPEQGELLWQLEVPILQMVPGIQHRGDLLLVAGGTHAGFETQGLRLSGTGKDTRAEVLWRTRRAVPGIASPVLVGDGFYTITDGGILTCYEPETGTVRWQERLEGKFWSSLVAGDGKVYALSHEGVLTTVAAGPAFEVLARGEFGSTCRATPAIASGRVLVRTEHELFCFESRARSER